MSLVDQRGPGALRLLPHRWVVGARGEYAHLPRTANRHDEGQRMTVTTLCGQMFHQPIITDDPAGPACGTCLGREQGLTVDGVIWLPRTIRTLPRRWCKNLGFVEVADRVGCCLLCGFLGPVRAKYGWTSSSVSLVRHEHNGAGRFCSEHGTRDLYVADGRVRCRSFRCSGVIRAFWRLGDGTVQRVETGP